MNGLTKLAAALALIAVLPATAVAQTVLTGGTVHVGNGEVIENGVVVIGADGKIAGVGKNVATPANAKVIDVGGKVVTPGLIDVDTQLGLVEIWAVNATRDSDPGPVDSPVKDPIRAAFRASDAFNPLSAAFAVQRVGGVTSAVTTPGGGLISGQGAFIDLDGELGDATIVDPTVVMWVQLGPEREGSRGLSMLRLREVFEDAKFYEANRKNFDENRLRQLSASRLDLLAIGEAVRTRRPMMFYVHRAADILAVLELAREYGLNPIIAGGAQAWMVANELAAAKVPVVLQPTHNLPWSFDMLGAREDSAALLAKAGVPVVLSVFDTHNARNLRYMAGNAVRGGLDANVALQAITKNAADAVGVGERYGTLEAGKVGNVVVWSGDPFEFSTAPEAIYIHGRPIDMQTRQTKLFDRYRELERRAPPAERVIEKAAESAGEDQNSGARDVESNNRAE